MLRPIMRGCAAGLIALLISSPAAAAWFPSDPTAKRGSLSFQWGYHRDFYSPSTIRFTGTGYDFTLHDVHASDRPDFERLISFFNLVAQYNTRVAYFVTDRLSVGLEFDHMKYVADSRQTVRMTGRIDPSTSAKFAGVYTGQRMHVGSDGDVVSIFEHTNGLNLASVGVDYLLPVIGDRRGWLVGSVLLGGGAGIIIPKTEVMLFETRLDNVFHFAGAALHASIGLHIDLFRFLFVEVRVKGGVVIVADALTVGDGRARHAMGFIATTGYFGLNLPLRAWFER